MIPISVDTKLFYKNKTIRVYSEKININLDNNETIFYYLYSNNIINKINKNIINKNKINK